MAAGLYGLSETEMYSILMTGKLFVRGKLRSLEALEGEVIYGLYGGITLSVLDAVRL